MSLINPMNSSNADDPVISSLIARYRQYRQNPGQGFPNRTIRDLLFVELFPGFDIVVASDSDGGIGPKEHDAFACPADVLGRLAVRVPLMEMFAAGASPLLVVDALAVEMDPTGKEIIRGVREEVAASGLDASKLVTGSTEDNVPTVQTGMGVVVVGLAEERDLRPGRSRIGDLVVSVGIPKTAPEDVVELDDPEIADVTCVRKMSQLDFVHDILPVGSHGTGYEIGELARTAGLKETLVDNPGIRLEKSGGPSTCVIASLLPTEVDTLRTIVSQPVHILGELGKP